VVKEAAFEHTPSIKAWHSNWVMTPSHLRGVYMKHVPSPHLQINIDAQTSHKIQHYSSKKLKIQVVRRGRNLQSSSRRKNPSSRNGSRDLAAATKATTNSGRSCRRTAERFSHTSSCAEAFQLEHQRHIAFHPTAHHLFLHL